MENPKRDYSVEFYRCLLMLGIVMIHAFGRFSYHPNSMISSSLLFCVPGFLFITGWYGAKFSWRKIIGLYGTALYSVVVVQIMSFLMDGRWGGAGKIFRDYWFLNAYVLLLLVVPVLNFAIEHGGWRLWIPFFLLVFGWGWFASFPPACRFFPRLEGVGDYTGLMAAGVYVASRLVRRSRVDERLKGRCLVCLFVVGLMAASFGFATYTSPIAFVMAASGFILIKRSNVAHRIGKYVSWMIPSLFSVYLLHTHAFGFSIMKDFQNRIAVWSGSWLIAAVLSAFCFFFAGIILDLPRRGGGAVCRCLVSCFTNGYHHDR